MKYFLTKRVKGGAKSSTEAVQIYDELIDKYGGSVSLLNGIAVSLMQAGNFQEADARLQEALNKVILILG